EKVLVAMVIARGQGSDVTGFIDDDGRYKLLNVPLGEVSIGVNTDAGKGQLMSKTMARTAGKQKGMPIPKVTDIPARYHEPSRSGIKTTVNKGPNQFDIVITR